MSILESKDYPNKSTQKQTAAYEQSVKCLENTGKQLK